MIAPTITYPKDMPGWRVVSWDCPGCGHAWRDEPTRPWDDSPANWDRRMIMVMRCCGEVTVIDVLRGVPSVRQADEGDLSRTDPDSRFGIAVAARLARDMEGAGADLSRDEWRALVLEAMGDRNPFAEQVEDQRRRDLEQGAGHGST